MTTTQYRLAQLKLELTIEKEKYEWYTKQADKQKEAEQSRRAQAQISREIWEAENKNCPHVSAHETRSQPNTKKCYWPQILTERLSILQQQLELSKGNTEEELSIVMRFINCCCSRATQKAERKSDAATGRIFCWGYLYSYYWVNRRR